MASIGFSNAKPTADHKDLQLPKNVLMIPKTYSNLYPSEMLWNDLKHVCKPLNVA